MKHVVDKAWRGLLGIHYRVLYGGEEAARLVEMGLRARRKRVRQIESALAARPENWAEMPPELRILHGELMLFREAAVRVITQKARTQLRIEEGRRYLEELVAAGADESALEDLQQVKDRLAGLEAQHKREQAEVERMKEQAVQMEIEYRRRYTEWWIARPASEDEAPVANRIV